MDDALSGALMYGHRSPPASYRLGGGPGTDARGCRTTSAGPTGPPGSPGTSFACQEDFDAVGTTDHVAIGFDVQTARNGCWRARVTSLHFVVGDGRGPPPQLARFPHDLHACGLPAVGEG